MKTPDDSQGVRMNDKGVKVKFAARISCFFTQAVVTTVTAFLALKEAKLERPRKKSISAIFTTCAHFNQYSND